ncbi:MAG: flippase [Candidatus Woesearchaeota archaeon]
MYLKNVLRGTIIVFILSIISGLFGYLLRMLLARKLSVADFGLFYSVMTVFLFISYIVDAGLGYSLSRKIVEFRVKKKDGLINGLIMSVASIQFIITLVIGAVLILLHNFLSLHYFHANASVLIFLGAAWIIFTPIIAAYTGIFYGFQKPEYSIFLEATKSFLVLLTAFILILAGYDYLSPAIAYLLTNILLVLIFYYLAKKVYSEFKPYSFRYDKQIATQTFNFGLIVGVSNFVWLIVLQIDTLLITYFMGTESVGIYQIAVTIAYLLLYFATSLSSVLYPLVNELNFKNERDTIVNGLNLVYKYLFIVLLPVVVIIFSFPDILINILFTSKYLGAVWPLKILALFTIFCSITLINNLVLTSLGKPKRVLLIVLVVAILNTILNFVTIPLFGLMGAACSTLFSFMIAAVLSSYELKKYIDIKFPLKNWALMVLISVLLVLEASIFMDLVNVGLLLKLFFMAAIICVSYLILIFLFRMVDLEEIKYFVKTFFKH